MRLLALCLITLNAITAYAADELAGLNGDGEKVIYCYYAKTMEMQLQGALMTDRSKAADMLRSVERWQELVTEYVRDPVTQQSAMQNATTRLSQRMRVAGGDPRRMLDEVITPTMKACSTLLSRLDTSALSQTPTTSVTAAPTTVPTTNEASVRTETASSDVFAGLFQSPLRGKFRWNSHSTVYASVRTQGTFARSPSKPTAFQLDFDSKITTLCVGELEESHRSEDGYLMHLTVKPGTGNGCEPRVTRGLLFPMALDDQRSNRRIMLRLYDDLGRMITASLFSSKAVENKSLDQTKLLATEKAARQMETENDNARRSAKLSNLKKNADFNRLEPFYNSCMSAAPSINGVMEASDYCVCMTYKFGTGERIPEAEFISYTQDFSRLAERFDVFTEDNTLYTRLAETCRSCSSPSGSLHPGCDEADSNLLMPSNFAQMIKQLDKPVVKLESSLFYKENFFVIYLQGYSNNCSDEISNPVPFDYVVTEYTTDPYAGTFANEIQRDRTYVERVHAKRYKQIYEKHAKLDPKQFQAAISKMVIRSEADLRRNQRDLNVTIKSETEKRVSVQSHLEQGCTSESVQRVYSNLDALFQ
ncbi:MAG: hypothetical protein AB8G18_01035 [Gammaproteobacteria bacterium]